MRTLTLRPASGGPLLSSGHRNPRLRRRRFGARTHALRALAAALVLAPLACTFQPATTPIAQPPNQRAGTWLAEAPPPTPTPPAATESEESQRGPRVVIQRIEGGDPGLQNAIGPLRSRLRDCPLGEGTSVQARLTRASDNKMTVDLGPTQALDDAAQNCIRAALTSVDLDGQLSRISPSDRVSNFTALLVFSW